MATLKFILYALGNTRIQPQDFEGKPDLDYNGHSSLQNPLSTFAISGDVDQVCRLVALGVKDRPLIAFFSALIARTFY